MRIRNEALTWINADPRRRHTIKVVHGGNAMAHSFTSASTSIQGYYCPMHTDVHQSSPGTCAKCGAELVAEGTRFALLQHVLANPLNLVAMTMAATAVMAAATMLVR
jgi:hypothetical protein